MTLPAACQRSREGLTEYLERALSPRRRQGIEKHLQECEGCRQLLAQLEAVVTASREVSSEPMPSRMKALLLRALRERM